MPLEIIVGRCESCQIMEKTTGRIYSHLFGLLKVKNKSKQNKAIKFFLSVLYDFVNSPLWSLFSLASTIQGLFLSWLCPQVCRSAILSDKYSYATIRPAVNTKRPPRHIIVSYELISRDKS